jgi:hypothetical protein
MKKQLLAFGLEMAGLLLAVTIGCIIGLYTL